MIMIDLLSRFVEIRSSDHEEQKEVNRCCWDNSNNNEDKDLVSSSSFHSSFSSLPLLTTATADDDDSGSGFLSIVGVQQDDNDSDTDSSQSPCTITRPRPYELCPNTDSNTNKIQSNNVNHNKKKTVRFGGFEVHEYDDHIIASYGDYYDMTNNYYKNRKGGRVIILRDHVVRRKRKSCWRREYPSAAAGGFGVEDHGVLDDHDIINVSIYTTCSFSRLDLDCTNHITTSFCEGKGKVNSITKKLLKDEEKDDFIFGRSNEKGDDCLNAASSCNTIMMMPRPTNPELDCTNHIRSHSDDTNIVRTFDMKVTTTLSQCGRDHRRHHRYHHGRRNAVIGIGSAFAETVGAAMVVGSRWKKESPTPNRQ